ncbi:MAG: hypothetical protein ACP5U1_07160 [Desulfomonilaceae bacterium]
MKRSLKACLVVVAGLCLTPQIQAQSGRPVYVVCRKYISERSCFKCSDYFHANSEKEAREKCLSNGYDEPNYFRSLFAVRRWLLGHCTCGKDD